MFAQPTRYACAVLLIVTSIAMAAYQVFDIRTVASGLLMYIAQAFLLAGSIFGLDYYVQRITGAHQGGGSLHNKGSSQQQSA